MPRIARIVGVGYPHHIVQRGNNREKVFFNERDKTTYLEFLAKYSIQCRVVIHAYCLMTNHVHILAVPNNEDSLAKMMQKLSLSYTQYVNKKYKRTGRLWECRFHSSLVDKDNYLRSVCRYIESNPIRAKIISKTMQYKWSSANVNTGMQEGDSFVTPIWETEKEKEEYKQFLNEDIEKDEAMLIRQKTYNGKPIAKENFLKEIKKVLGIELYFRSRGRPKKLSSKPR